MRTQQEIEEALEAARQERKDMQEAADGSEYGEERNYFKAEATRANRKVSILSWVLGSKEEDEKAARVQQAIRANKTPDEADLPF
jgi:hypothetical protein